jgi:hypothetical protein
MAELNLDRDSDAEFTSDDDGYVALFIDWRTD